MRPISRLVVALRSVNGDAPGVGGYVSYSFRRMSHRLADYDVLTPVQCVDALTIARLHPSPHIRELAKDAIAWNERLARSKGLVEPREKP